MLDERLAERALELGQRLVGRLRAADLPRVREIRHVGLMVGIELREKAVPHVMALLEEGLLTFPAGTTVIRVFPPLTIEPELLDEVAERLVRVLGP